MKEGESDGFVPKIFSVIVLLGMIFLSPLAGGIAFLAKAIPIAIVPFLLIWFPEDAQEFFSSHATRNDVRKWGVAGIIFIIIPIMIALLAFQ